jgi:hypothetical protein
MIPKIIHYGWFGDQSKKPIERIESWRQVLPNFEIREWNESNLDLSKHRFSRLSYDLEKYGTAFDEHRADILYECGGVWFDTDVIVHKDITPFLDYSFFIGYEDKTCFNLGTMGAEPHHPILLRVQQWYKENCDSMTLHLTENEFIANYIHRMNCSRVILGAMRVLYGFIPNGKPATFADRIRVEAVPTFTIRGDYSMTNYIEHLYEGSWRPSFDYVAMLKQAYEKHAEANIWKAIKEKM